MVDVHLPLEDKNRPLAVLFLDLNAYFASVEQAERPELRNRPIAVCPVTADGGTVIAASYEAKEFGVKTGTKVGDAKRMCPEIVIVDGRHTLYTYYHDLVKAAVETVLPIKDVRSIDEMSFRLIGKEREPDEAHKIALRIKEAIRDLVSPWLTCSIGIAPNEFLAKLGTDMQKPDGLVVIRAEDLPEKIQALPVRAFCGINKKMAARLGAAGMFSSDDMLKASKEELRCAFGSVVGERWWYELRGYKLEPRATHRRSLGHSHVMPPAMRTDEGARSVLIRLIQKATARLRDEDLWASEIHFSVSAREQGWKVWTKVDPLQDTVSVVEEFQRLWQVRSFVGLPTAVSVTFAGLRPTEQVTPSLFSEKAGRTKASHAVDKVNQKHGKNRILLASNVKGKDTAPERIAFGKTTLMKEGKGDNEWPGPGTGPDR